MQKSVLALEVIDAYKTFVDEDEGPQQFWRRFLHPASRRRVVAVDRVSFRVQPGEVYGILGPNGSGKSTLIRLIATLLSLDGGRIRIFGLDVQQDLIAVRRLMNRVSVDAAFFKKLSAMENLDYAARLYGLPIGEARRRAGEMLERLGLSSHKWYTPLENLSRGQQQKVAIVRALLTNPALLLLDEPTTGLDPQSKRDVQDYLLEVQQRHHTTIILTSHDMAEAERLCRRVAFIHDGRFVAEGTPEELKARFGCRNLEDVFFAVTGRRAGEEDIGA
ncbi:MAG TPA: ABC transporter ATP-binding protein [Symbiobacteriaceae bacterium]